MSNLYFSYSNAQTTPHCERSQSRFSPLRVLLLCSLLGLAVISAGCFESKVVTSRVVKATDQTKAKDMNGVFYALPRTVVKVDVPVARIDKEPGQFKDYIKCFYPNVADDDYISAESTQFKIAADRVKFDTAFVPDPEEIFMIKTMGGMFETRNLELELTESGVLIKASGETTNETIDIVTGGIKAGISLAAKASSAGLFDTSAVDAMRNQLPHSQRRCLNTAESNLQAAKDQVKAELRNNLKREPTEAEVDARLKHADLPTIRAADDFFQAQEAFKFISELEEQRRKILSPTDGPADTFKLALEELDKTIENYKQVFFFGTKSTLTWNPSFRLNPSDAVMSIDLFQLSKDKGVCEITANAPPHNQGVPFDGRFKLEGCTNGEMVQLAMEKGETGEGNSNPDGNSFAKQIQDARLQQNGNRGFYYRIPGRGIAFLRRATTELARAPLSIAQFGQVVSLPASTGGRRTKYTLALYEASGGLKNFVMGSDALVKQKNIDDLTGAATTAIETKGERNKAKAPADELQQLERQRKILEEKKKIRDLEKELDNTGTSPGP